MKYQVLKGMSDVLPGEIEKWQFVEKRARDFFESRGFREIRTPVLEQTDLFTRSIGEASDIVHKEMYTFVDRGDRSLTLRPEMTASVARAAIENHLLRSGVQRLYYMGPMFRAERPQAGRKRQFHQIGAEILGAGGAEQDLELLILVDGLLKYLGVPGVRIKINNLGSRVEREQYKETLRSYFEKNKAKLCSDCQFRFEKNVMRILDCKVAKCQHIIENRPKMIFGDISTPYFQQVLDGLERAKVNFEVDSRVVRGLDYYNFCVFEATAEGLGSQDAICAGGRYDGLLADLGGNEGGACGFALGVERLLMTMNMNQNYLAKMMAENTVYFASMMFENPRQPVTKEESEIALKLISHGIRVIFGKHSANLRDHLKKANEAGAGFILIRGSEEANKGKVAVKDLTSGTQEEVDEQKLIEYFLSVKAKNRD